MLIGVVAGLAGALITRRTLEIAGLLGPLTTLSRA